MHLGHSHSHHHHHLHHPDQPQSTTSTTTAAQPLSPQQQRMRRLGWRRQVALILCCALATLGPRFLYTLRTTSFKAALVFQNADVAAFLLSALGFTFADQIRWEILQIMHKFKATVQQVAKHSPPLRTILVMPPSEEAAAATAYNNQQIVSSGRTVGNKKKGKADPAMRVTLIGVLINLVLSIGKWVVGVGCHSSALIADAGHSLSDLVSDFVTLFAVQVARLPPDDDHPYGHGKFEAIGSLFLAMTLLATGLSVGAMSNKNLLQIVSSGSGSASTGAATAASAVVAIPKPPALIMAGISILSKEWLFRITRVVGKRLNSQVLMANAWHHRSDAYSSVLALISIGLAMFVPGMLAADSFAGLLVAGMICMTGADIMGESIKQLSDHNNEELVAQVTEIVQQSSPRDIKAVDQVRARQVGSQAMVDVKLTTTMEQAQMSATATRTLEERIRQKILTNDAVAHIILDAEVRAMPPTTTSSASSASLESSSTFLSSSSSASTTTEATPLISTRTNGLPGAESTDVMERDIRNQALSTSGIASVEAVAIRVDSSLMTSSTPLKTRISVDVAIRLEDSYSMVSQAMERASQLRSDLEAWDTIGRANVFLDLNHQNPTTNVIPNGGRVDAPHTCATEPSSLEQQAGSVTE
ncbi:hypothetical protein ACA910_001129 [Epithemia clementina (nom. ined.)]